MPARRARVLGFALAFFIASVPLARADEKKADPPAKEKEKEKPEVHVVGIYSGYNKSNGEIHGGRAQVLVNRPGKHVILVLVSYESVTWEVGVNKDTKVEKVILGGYARKAAVKGLPDGVEVVEAFRGSKDPKLPLYAYKTDDPSFQKLVEAIGEMTGQPKLASFTGKSRAEFNEAIAVEDVSKKDERIEVDFPKVVPADKLPKLTFRAIRLVPGERPHEVTRSFGDFTLAGPKADTFKPLPRNVDRVAYDPNGKQFFGIYSHSLASVDLDNKKVTEIDTSLDVPEISWPSDITFDSKRNRVLLSTFGGGGYLYSYTPKTGKWEALAEKPAHWLAYDSKNDILYGVRGDLRGGGAELQEINAKGAVVSATALDGEFPPGVLAAGPRGGGVQLIAADGKLVLLYSPAGIFGGENAGQKWSYMYLIDPKTAKAQLVWKEKAKEKEKVEK